MSRSLRAEKLEAMRLLAEHHIEDVRYSRKGRELIAVKHSVFGWISPAGYYALQKADALLPELIQGGYRLKQALWSFQISIVGFTIPAGGLIPAYAMTKASLGIAAKDPSAVEWILAAALPFGDLWILLRMLLDAAGVADQAKDTLHQGAELGFFGLIGYVFTHPELADQIRRLLPF